MTDDPQFGPQYLQALLRSNPGSTQIDPLNTLIERLIEDHEWEWADRLSQLYLKLLAPDI